jgi:apolipoprotein N-acyltransferase
MASALNFPRIGVALLAVASTAILVWFGYGLNPWWPLLWFAPLPVLLFAARNSWGNAALVAACSWFLGLFSLWHYLHTVLGTIAACVALFATEALAFTFAVLLFRGLLLRGASWAALLAFPAAWVSIEYVHNLTSVHGTGGSLAYSQLNFLPFLQLASITGPWGMTFLLLLFSSAIAVGLHLRQTAPRQALRIVGSSFAVILLVLVFGVLRLASPPPAGSQVKVGLIASDLRANEGVVDAGAGTEQLFRDYSSRAESLAAQGAQVVVLPEKLGVTVDPDTTTTDAILQSLADKTGATIIAGVVRVAAPLKYNEARIYAPRAALRSYDKHHMLPPFESDLEPGTTRTLLPQPAGAWGVAICKDMDFTDLSRQYGKDGAGLMLVPAWDFFVDRTWHGHEAIMRGVESGFVGIHGHAEFFRQHDDLRSLRSKRFSSTAIVAK